MSIAIKPTAANQVRALRQQLPYLSPEEIRELTGFKLKVIKAALETRGYDKVKTKAAEPH